MSEHPRFTLIVSGYQNEPYLPKTLDSIAKQTFRDFEAICYVEDSSDKSLELCRDFSQSDSRFKIASGPKTGGVGATRNYGIEHASGEYLVVVDGDDWIVPDMLETLDEKLRTIGVVDVVAFAAISTEVEDFPLDHAKAISNFDKSCEIGVFSGLEAIRRSGRRGGGFHSFTWLNIYRTAFLREHHLYQQVGWLMEDFGWMPHVFVAAEKLAYVDRKLYIYRRRPGSLTTENMARSASHAVHQFRSLAEFAAKQNLPEDILTIFSNQWLATLYWFLFHPVTSRKIPDSERRNALKALFADEGRTYFQRLVKLASLPKRIATPLVYLAARGWQMPAKIYFRQFYYPLVNRRQIAQK